ncbi:pyruvate dehydrogenase (acetyl-transferring), homodimeric type [Brevibacterium oceani]|uniref:pyruvate dehydrogenase (acetyl-transferring), homodimeric type n=1 Tax=Brevibacterium oceani TaxID=358099 RepID=UPI001B32B941|nr:pyruvate dehydrogenase (acetyl-transferring), homodimeric type [Brevibacterium oceani]
MTQDTTSANLRSTTTDEEVDEWLESWEGLVGARGTQRAGEIMEALRRRAATNSIAQPKVTTTDYVNTIPADQEPIYPGEENVERRYRRWLRWNAAMLVHRAQRPEISVGGHISTYAGAATLYEIGFNNFFRGQDHPGGGDQVFFQGHASPGMYARAFLEGRLSEADLDGFRQEASKAPHGLSSYPHPRLMPEFWQFPTVSMGLGPINAIYQAQMNRYLHNRGVKDTSDQRVWAFLGDGEMDEPESRGALQLAANEGLDNLTFVINCNLQRLDGPVRGNGKIVQELEATFTGAGWDVIKVLWGREWDSLLEADHTGELVRIMNETLDGDYQTFKAESGGFIRDNFFGRSPTTKGLVEHLSDDDIWNLKRGGHDYHKVFAAYQKAVNTKGKPTVILVQTVKGYGLGTSFESRNATHQMKKFTADDVKAFRDRMDIPISDKVIDDDPYAVPYYHPGADDDAIQYMLDRRRQLGGFLPARKPENNQKTLPAPSDKAFSQSKKGSGKQLAATTMAFVRLLKDLMREKGLGERIVPIIPDEARTFGIDAFFPTAKIYNPNGQNYLAVDRELFLSYKEAVSGQLLHVGINEAGAAAGFTAAGTAYSTHGEPMIPIYVFYSMFGFQRTGDAFWAAGDQMTRGFIIGATAGRTTLTGEGLQHADGHSPVLAATNPAVRVYDPAYGYEIGHIVRDGLHRMYGEHDLGEDERNVMYYLTVYNEPMVQPAEPDNVDVEGILKGIHRVAEAGTPAEAGQGSRPQAQLLASGVAVPWALEARELLAADWGVEAAVWSVTSWAELRRDALECEAELLSDVEAEPRVPYVRQRLGEEPGPIVATSDFDSTQPDLVRPFLDQTFATLGADGFGFSDTRAAARRHFKIDAHSMVVRTLQLLARRGEIDPGTPAEAARRYELNDVNAGTSGMAGGDS